MTNRFDGKAVLVTGAGVSIDLAICSCFAREGVWVALNDMDEQVARAAAQKLNELTICWY